MSVELLRKIDAAVPLSAKLDPILRELRSLHRDRRSDMLRQEYRGVESALTSLDAALAALKSRKA
jgi:hypothetical protein